MQNNLLLTKEFFSYLFILYLYNLKKFSPLISAGVRVVNRDGSLFGFGINETKTFLFLLFKFGIAILYPSDILSNGPISSSDILFVAFVENLQ